MIHRSVNRNKAKPSAVCCQKYYRLDLKIPDLPYFLDVDFCLF